MKATINNDLCAQCMSCVSNCPYQAATQRGDKFYVSSFCTGCGNCIAFCPTGAVSVSDELIELDNQKNDAALKELLGIKKPIVAMKYANAPLEGMETEEGPTFWCALCGNVCAAAADPIFFTVKSIICGGASLFGLGNRKVKVTKQEMHEALVATKWSARDGITERFGRWAKAGATIRRSSSGTRALSSAPSIRSKCPTWSFSQSMATKPRGSLPRTPTTPAT